MIKQSLLVIFIFFINRFFAQDTLFTQSGQTLLVRVLEISSRDVTYKNFYNPDGVLRKLENKEIRRIVYENGKEESLFQIREKTAADIAQPPLFVIEDKHIAVNGIDISHAEAYKMMRKRDPQQNSDELNWALMEAESKRNGQIAFNILAPASLVGGVYLARRNRYNDPRERLRSRAFILSGLSICVVSVITAQVYKSLKNNRIRKAALLYNSEM